MDSHIKTFTKNIFKEKIAIAPFMVLDFTNKISTSSIIHPNSKIIPSIIKNIQSELSNNNLSYENIQFFQNNFHGSLSTFFERPKAPFNNYVGPMIELFKKLKYHYPSKKGDIKLNNFKIELLQTIIKNLKMDYEFQIEQSIKLEFTEITAYKSEILKNPNLILKLAKNPNLSDSEALKLVLFIDKLKTLQNKFKDISSDVLSYNDQDWKLNSKIIQDLKKALIKNQNLLYHFDPLGYPVGYLFHFLEFY